MGRIAAEVDSGDSRQASGDTEGAVLEAVGAGDHRLALTLLMNAYGASLYRFCRQFTGEDALAEDVHQTTFVQAYQGLARFAHRSSFRTWLFGIARHRCLDALKGQRRRRARFELVEEPPPTPDASGGAHERLDTLDRRRTLEGCLETLAPRIREAVLLRYQQETSYAEMAVICKERAATLQARVARALPVLRRCLEDHGVSP